MNEDIKVIMEIKECYHKWKFISFEFPIYAECMNCGVIGKYPIGKEETTE